MLQLVLCIGIAVAAALVLRARPVLAVCLVLMVWGAIPAVAAHQFTGQETGLALHPATWLVLAVFGVQLLFRPTPLAQAASRHPLVVLAGIVFAVGCVWTSQVNGSGGQKLLLDQIVAPMLVFFLLVANGHRRRSDVLMVRTTVLLLAALQSGLAIVQSVVGRMIFFESDYETLYWFNPLKFDRWMGTTDSPLILAYLLCVASALAVGVTNVALRFGLLGLYLVAVLITQSRVGVAIVCAVILYAVLRSRMAIWARSLVAFAVVAAGYILVTSTLIAGFASRLADDTGSVDARQRALGFIFDNWQGYLVAGQGLTASYSIARGAGLVTSIESSILMYAIDVGWILTLIYFGVQAALLIRHGTRSALIGTTIAAGIALVLPHGSSALAWSNLSGTLLWTSLALLVMAGSISRRQGADGYRLAAPAFASAATSSGV